jgi:predicted PurR-regulated permease PerM
MNSPSKTDFELEERIASRVMDVFIRIGLVVVLALLCYRIFSPFLTLMLWALILSVALYPAHRAVARKVGGRQWLAATLIVILGIALIVVPSSVLMSSLGDSLHRLIHGAQTNTLEIPPPVEAVATWPLIGPKLHSLWTQAHADLPALVQSLQPQIGDVAKSTLAFVAGIGVGLLQFLAAIIIAGIIMAFGEAGARAHLAIFRRVIGPARGAEFAKLSAATVRAVAQGVLGVAFIQALIVGIILLVAGVPWAGVLALFVLVLGIAQVPALIVTLPAIGYIWWIGTYSTAAAIAWTILLGVSGMADNVLKPLMLGRGVKAPMVVILLGALGGMATSGILGMFVGATLLTLGYQIFMGWVAGVPERDEPGRQSDYSTANKDGPTVAE